MTAVETWKRREATVMAVLPYGLLAFSALVSVVVQWQDDVLAPTLALSAVAALWMAGFTLVRPALLDRPAVAGVFFAGLVALMAVLCAIAPWYGFFAFTGYLQLPRLPRAWGPAALVAVAVTVALSQAGGAPDSGGDWALFGALAAVNVAVAGALTFFGTMTERISEERAAAIDELTEVNARLQATLRENEGLQAQLLAQAREAGVVDERQRMAREIHDTLAQGLMGILTQLQAAEGAEPHGPRWRRHLDAAARLARESLSEARRSVHALRPEPLDGTRLPDALADVARGWSALHDVEAGVTVTGDARPLRPEIEVALLRTAQEGLANVAKHAHATRVAITLSYMGDVVTLDVCDDGGGFVPGAVSAERGVRTDGGFGLTAMRERLSGLDGRLAVESEPGRGTALSATLPAVAA